jgi:hypothetical protein
MKLLILAGVHGDEPAAVEAARRLARLFRDSEEVEVVPEANPEACFAGTRLSPSDGKDLNRCFPGNEEGTSTERLAFRLFQKVLEAEVVVDLHTPSMGRAYLPHARLRVDSPKLRELCSYAGMDYATLDVPEQGMLQVEASQRGIPVLTLEAGEGGKAGEETVNALVEAVLGVARSLGVAEGEAARGEVRFVKRERILSDASGKLKMKVALGDKVRLGTIVAKVGKTRIKSHVNGIVLGVSSQEYVEENEFVASIGVEVQHEL